MATDLEQRKQVVELLGEGSARRIHVIVASLLALVGVVLQGLVYWHAAQMADKEWGTVGMQVWAFAVGAWILIMGLLNGALEATSGGHARRSGPRRIRQAQLDNNYQRANQISETAVGCVGNRTANETNPVKMSRARDLQLRVSQP